MSQTPLVSILIPVFNRPVRVVQAIESAQAQTYPHIEVIIVDNDSTDNTFDVVQGYASHDPRIRCFRNDTNLGPIPNWLKCVEYSQGEYVKILFSDDWLDPDAISKHLEPFGQHASLAFTFSRVQRHSEIKEEEQETDFLFEFGHNRSMTRLEFLSGYLKKSWSSFYLYPVSPGAAMFRRKDVIRSLRDSLTSYSKHTCTQLGIGADLLLYLHACERHESVYYVDDLLNHFLAHESGLSFQNISHIDRCYFAAYLWFLHTVRISIRDKFHLYRKFLQRIFEEHYPTRSDFLRPFRMIEGLRSSGQWWLHLPLLFYWLPFYLRSQIRYSYRLILKLASRAS